MGFRSTMVTEDNPVEWPVWFHQKYLEKLNFNSDSSGRISGVLSTKMEWAIYKSLEELHEDIYKVIGELGLARDPFHLVWLHECGGITKVEIYPEGVFIGTLPLESAKEPWAEGGMDHGDWCHSGSCTMKIEG